MRQSLIVKDEIRIQANPEKIWDVLIKPIYVSQWDELPENYPNEDMAEDSQVVWELPNGEKSITTITRAVKNQELKIVLNVTNWLEKPKDGDIAYLYQLENNDDHTLLKIEIGDFSLLKDGQMYFDASIEFAANAKKVIKNLAESLN